MRKRKEKGYALVEEPAGGGLACVCAGRGRPDAFMGELERELRERGHEGALALDLLAANGSLSRRFMALRMEKGRLRWLDAKLAAEGEVGAGLRRACDAFHLSHPEALAESSLSKGAWEALLEGAENKGAGPWEAGGAGGEGARAAPF